MRILFVMGIVGVLLPGFVSAQTLWSGTSVADAFVTTGSANTLEDNNYGGAGALMISAAGLAKGEFQSVVLFDVATAVSTFDTTYGAGQWTVTSVTMSLTATSPNNAIFNAISAGNFSIDWMGNDTWTEGTGSPNAPGAAGITFTTLQSTYRSPSDSLQGTFAWPGGTSGSTTWTLTPTASLLNDIAAAGPVGFRLYAADTTASYLFNSRNFGTASRRPVLTITAVPEPSLLALTGLGLAGILIARRRRFER